VFFAECSISVPLDVNPGKQIVELLERVFETYPVSSASFGDIDQYIKVGITYIWMLLIIVD
jgi:hypothetical protein